MNTRAEKLENIEHKDNSNKKSFDFKTYSTLIALTVLFIILTLLTDGDFLSARNFTNLSRQISINGLLAVGMTLIILTAGIDLSVGSVVALSGVVAGLLQVNLGLAQMGALGTTISVISAVLIGLFCGTINGGLISVFKIPPFVISLGMMVMAAGTALIASNSSAISPMSSSYKFIAKGFIGNTSTFIIFSAIGLFWLRSLYRKFKEKEFKISALIFSSLLEIFCIALPFYAFSTDRGVPLPVFYLMIITAVIWWGLKNLSLGRFIYAIGGNEEAALLSGINVKKIKWSVYAIMGALAGFTGVILSARLNSASPTIGTLMELDAIAAVVIGGTSLMGGVGSVIGSIMGAFLIGTLNNGMDLMDIDSNYQMVIKGMIIIFAVWSDARTKQKAK